MLSPITIEKENVALVKTTHIVVPASTGIKIEALSVDSETRAAVECFIQRGYLNTYQANINITTPYLIALEKCALKSALGVRSGKQTLFTEQYLALPIEQELSMRGFHTKRSEIAEIAHLYSNAKVFTVPLMLVTALALQFKGFSSMVFTGTEHVINLIKRTGIKVEQIANADASMLSSSDDNWGTYYDTQPVVACIALQDVIDVIQSTPKLFKMFEELTSQVADVVSQLEAL